MSEKFSKNMMSILIGSAIILAISLGIRHGFGLYLVPMSTEFHWGLNVFSLAIALQNLIWGAAQPFTGALADKYGTQKTVIVGGALYCLGLLMMSVSSSGALLNLSVGLILGLALSATSFSVLLSAVGRAAPAGKSSLAMGIASAAGSFGQFIMLPSTLFFLKNFGWSAALVISAILSALMIPLAIMLKAPTTAPQQIKTESNSLSLKAVLDIAKDNRSFWLLCVGFFVCGFQVVFIGVHMPSYLRNHGFTDSTGTIFLALVGLFNIVGTYVAGWLGDKYSKTHLLMGIYGLRGIVIILFLAMPLNIINVYLFGIAMGLLWLSTVPLTNGIVVSMFGVKFLTTLVGIVFFGHQIGAFFGGWLGGVSYDLTGSYTSIWIFSIFLSGVGVVAHYFINENSVFKN